MQVSEWLERRMVRKAKITHQRRTTSSPLLKQVPEWADKMMIDGKGKVFYKKKKRPSKVRKSENEKNIRYCFHNLDPRHTMNENT